MRALVSSEQDLLRWALETARRFGDPKPTLIQHATTTRDAAATALGWGTCEKTPVYVVVLKGKFSVKQHRHARPCRRRQDADATFITVPVLFRVIEIETGRVVDSGSKRAVPDLTALAPITTDLSSEV